MPTTNTSPTPSHNILVVKIGEEVYTNHVERENEGTYTVSNGQLNRVSREGNVSWAMALSNLPNITCVDQEGRIALGGYDLIVASRGNGSFTTIRVADINSPREDFYQYPQTPENSGRYKEGNHCRRFISGGVDRGIIFDRYNRVWQDDAPIPAYLIDDLKQWCKVNGIDCIDPNNLHTNMQNFRRLA